MVTKKIRILIVCTGNSCRSPMAEGFLRRYLVPEGEYEICSAGTAGLQGFSPTKEAIEVMKQEEIDISGHVSNALNEDVVMGADLILVMEGSHKHFIVSRFPFAREKVYLYKEFAGGADPYTDIDDPIGKTIEFYKKVGDDIKAASLDIVTKLKQERKG